MKLEELAMFYMNFGHYKNNITDYCVFMHLFSDVYISFLPKVTEGLSESAYWKNNLHLPKSYTEHQPLCCYISGSLSCCTVLGVLLSLPPPY